MTSIRAWFHLASGSLIGRLLGFVSNLLLSRWLGPSDLGLFNLVTTTVQTSDTLVRCGGDYALNFELGGQSAALQTENGLQLARGFSQLCSFMTLLFCAGVACWVWAGQALIPITFDMRSRLTLSCLLLLMIAFEGSTAPAWEVLLVSHKTSKLALKQGLFIPLRLLTAAFLAHYGGVVGAMSGWCLIAFIQFVWLRIVLGHYFNPFILLPPLWAPIHQLLRRGIPFYATNLLSSMIFFPLLLSVAKVSGLADIGYLRAGQILQQLFAFLPATLVPLLFLKLRAEATFTNQVLVMEKPLRIVWFVLLEVLLVYCIVDHSVLLWLFGSGFTSALLPTRLLLIIALFESLAQLFVQPLLAAGQTRIYGIWQNVSAVFAAVLGWLWIPTAGMSAYLVVRVIHVVLPLVGFGVPVIRKLQEPQRVTPLALSTVLVLLILLIQAWSQSSSLLVMPLFPFLSILILLFYYKDAISLASILKRTL